MALVRLLWSVAAVATAVSIATAAQAQQSPVRPLPQKGVTAFTPQIGTAVNIGGTFAKSASETFAAAGTLFGQPFNAAATFSTEKKDFDDVYHAPLILGGEVSYGLSDSAEIFTTVRFAYAGAKEFDAVRVNAAVTWGGATLTANSIVKGEADDYHELGFDLGYRHFFMPSQTFRPFVSGLVGLRWVDEINVTLTSGGARVGTVKFFDTSISWAAGVGAGFRYDVEPGIALGAEVGVRYSGELRDDDADLGTGSYSRSNDSGDRWDVPIMFGLTFKI